MSDYINDYVAKVRLDTQEAINALVALGKSGEENLERLTAAAKREQKNLNELFTEMGRSEAAIFKAAYNEREKLLEKAKDASGRTARAITKIEEDENAKRIRMLREDIIARNKLRQKEIEDARAAQYIGGDRALRIGAGVSTMMGNYRMAGGMYAAANMAGVAGVGIPTGLAVAGAGAAGVAGGGAAFLSYGRELNKTLADMSTLYSENTANAASYREQIAALGVEAGKLVAIFEEDIISVVKGMKEALSSGIDESQLTTFMQNALQLKMVLGSDLTTSISALTTVMTVYHKSVYDLNHVNDVFFNIVDLGKIKVEALNGHLGKVASAASAAGVSFEDLGAGLIALTNAGFRNGQEFTAMYRIIDGLTNPTEKAKKGFDRLGIAYGENALKGRTFAEVMQEIKQKTGGSLTAIGELFDEAFAKRGVAAITNMIDKLKDYRNEVDNAHTATMAQIKIQDNLWHRIGAGIDNVTSKLKNASSAAADFLNRLTGGGNAAQNYGDMYGPSGVVAGVINKNKALDLSGSKGINYRQNLTGSNVIDEAATRVAAASAVAAMEPAYREAIVYQLQQSGMPVTPENILDVYNEVAKRQREAKYKSAYDDITKSSENKQELFASSDMNSANNPFGIKELSKANQKRLRDRISPEQDNTLHDLMALREDAMAEYEAIKKQIKIEYESGLQPLLEERLDIERKLKEAIESENTDLVNVLKTRLKQINDEYNAMSNKLATKAMFDPRYRKAVDKVDSITGDINKTQQQILEQDTRQQVQEAEKRAREELAVEQRLQNDKLDAYKKYLERTAAEHKKALDARKKYEDLMNDMSDVSKNRHKKALTGWDVVREGEKTLPKLISEFEAAIKSGDLDRARELRPQIEQQYDDMKSAASSVGEGARFEDRNYYGYDRMVGNRLKSIMQDNQPQYNTSASQLPSGVNSFMNEQFAKAIKEVEKATGTNIITNIGVTVPEVWSSLASEIQKLVTDKVAEALKTKNKEMNNGGDKTANENTSPGTPTPSNSFTVPVYDKVPASRARGL